MSHVRTQVSGVTIFFLCFGARQWRFCYQQGLPRLVLHTIKMFDFYLDFYKICFIMSENVQKLIQYFVNNIY